MSDDSTAPTAGNDPYPNWSEDSDPDGLTRKDFEPQDWLLEVLLDYAFGQEIEATEGQLADPPSFGATFNTHGLVVSGMVVHSDIWIRDLAATFSAADESAARAGAFIGAVWDGARKSSEDRRARREEGGLPQLPRTFICMRNVTIFAPGRVLHHDFWRLRLRDVTGWSPSVDR